MLKINTNQIEKIIKTEESIGKIIINLNDWKKIITQYYPNIKSAEYVCSSCKLVFTADFPPCVCPKCQWSLYGLLESAHYLIDFNGNRQKTFFSPNSELNLKLLDFDISKAFIELQEKLLAKYKDQDTWEKFQWDEWIPLEVRESIKEFWKFQRGTPFNWIKDFRPYEPLYGTIVTKLDFGDKEVKGKFLHVWNNIGRVIDDMGKIHYVSS